MWMHADKYVCNSHLKYNDAYMWMHTNALLRTRTYATRTGECTRSRACACEHVTAVETRSKIDEVVRISLVRYYELIRKGLQERFGI